MKFADFLTKTKVFLINRATELLGIIIISSAVAVFVSLISYSPTDPNFITNNSEKVKNLLGYRGAIISDFLFQAIGLMAYLISVTLFISGINILIFKKQLVIVDNLFFSVLYIISGCLMYSYFRNDSFFLTINGNGGFVGLFLKESFLSQPIEINKTLSFYILNIITFFLFLISINFKITNTLKYFFDHTKFI